VVLVFWGRPLVTFSLLSLASLVTWAITDSVPALAVFGAGMLILNFHHLRNLRALCAWIKKPESAPLPDGGGTWAPVFSSLARMRRQQLRSESRLSAALERFQQAAAAMPEGVAVLDDEDCIEWCNPKAAQHFGLDPERDHGQPITHLVRQPQFAEYLSARNYSEPVTVRFTREGELVLSVMLVPYGDQQKLLISRNITRWERLETMRRDFVANVSHELRTPLTVVRGFLETLSDSEAADPDLTRRSLKLMSEQTLRMQRLVEDLLTLAKLENMQTPLAEELVDVQHLASSLYQDALTLSGGRHKIKLKSESAARLLGSEEELRSAFSNLISNAIRYTSEKGSIAMGWRQVGGEAMFWVQDNGIGIEPHHIPRLTERFYRVDRSRSRESGGTGLGLAIVKHVLSRHQGRLEIDSTPGQGSTFRALFPATRVREPESAARASS
jgi:two-component system, OmpR family, phosphate regulon sensor histidine kinase PhoR